MRIRSSRLPAIFFLPFLATVYPHVESQQKSQQPLPPPAQPMPSDRADDSYHIYSKLLPLGETAAWPADFYAVQDTTLTAVQPNEPCAVPPPKTASERDEVSDMNPHVAITPPENARQDYAQMLADFDAHCHERLILTQASLKTKLPIHLLGPAQQKEFQTIRNSNLPPAKKMSRSPALYAFSEVYFNTHHTVAMVYASDWCGNLCGQGFWVILGKGTDGTWKGLNWSTTT